MLILDKLRALDLLVARSEVVAVPEEFRWGHPPGASDTFPSVQDADGRRRLAHAIVLRPVPARRERTATPYAERLPYGQHGSPGAHLGALSLHP